MSLRSPFRVGLGVLTLWPFLPIVARVPLYGRLIVELLADRRVPASRKAVLGLAAAYLASPIDLIPDFVPFISRLDDLAVVVIALDLFMEGVPRELMIEKMYQLDIDGRELERDLETFRRFVPGPVRSAARRLPAALEKGMGLIGNQFVQRLGRGAPGEAAAPQEVRAA
jgi:uncharacterized membrane protein YkvA (DUF1232 family)